MRILAQRESPSSRNDLQFIIGDHSTMRDCVCCAIVRDGFVDDIDSQLGLNSNMHLENAFGCNDSLVVSAAHLATLVQNYYARIASFTISFISSEIDLLPLRLRLPLLQARRNSWLHHATKTTAFAWRQTTARKRLRCVRSGLEQRKVSALQTTSCQSRL